MKRAIVAAGAAVAAAVFLAPLAQADQHGYDQWMISQGVTSNGSGLYSEQNLAAQGNYACAQFQQGSSDASVIDHFESQMGIAQSQDIVYAAHHYLCP